MLKASALYLVVIIALIIALICSSLIAVAYFYRSYYQQKFRFDRLQDNVESGINILLAGDSVAYYDARKFSLFDNGSDSLQSSRLFWGAYDVGTVQAFIQSDTLFKTFLIAGTIDSSKWSAVYVIDEDRPLSVSGHTSIIGNAYLPKAGIRAAYVDNKAYSGDPKFVIGHTYNSERALPSLNQQRVDQLYDYMAHPKEVYPFSLIDTTVENSFLKPERSVYLKDQDTLRHINWKGNIILYSDTTIFIDSSARLDNVMIFAKSIVVGDQFRGRCQFFATDSISVGKNCTFVYPSCLGILRGSANHHGSAPQIRIGENTILGGILFTSEKEKNELPAMVIFEKNTKITGQVYVQGNVLFRDNLEINGSVACRRFLYKTAFSAYENYLINARLDSRGLSPYYLPSMLLPSSGKNKKILQWLEAN